GGDLFRVGGGGGGGFGELGAEVGDFEFHAFDRGGFAVELGLQGGGGLGGFGFEGGDFAAGFAELVEFFFGFLVAGLGVTAFFGEAFVLLFQFVQACGLFAVDLRHVSFGVEDGRFAAIERGRAWWGLGLFGVVIMCLGIPLQYHHHPFLASGYVNVIFGFVELRQSRPTYINTPSYHPRVLSGPGPPSPSSQTVEQANIHEGVVHNAIDATLAFDVPMTRLRYNLPTAG
ncbi:MAG: hypothetical protein Q9228_004378, partial [Teloschistes exilis]